jgi:hypothetical protein
VCCLVLPCQCTLHKEGLSADSSILPELPAALITVSAMLTPDFGPELSSKGRPLLLLCVVSLQPPVLRFDGKGAMGPSRVSSICIAISCIRPILSIPAARMRKRSQVICSSASRSERPTQGINRISVEGERCEGAKARLGSSGVSLRLCDNL